MERLALGTVQLGVPYGVANRTGKPERESALSIVQEAWKRGIRTFDTAQGYGDSESVLGEAFERLGISDSVRVISKFDPRLDHGKKSLLEESLEMSLRRLRVPSLDGMMLHREEFLALWNNGLYEVLGGFVKDGRIGGLGVSVYSPSAAIQALNMPGIDIIQVPASIFDMRFEDAGVFDRAAEKGKKVFVRSVFLQGLIVMEPDEVPEHLARVRPALGDLRRLCLEFNMGPKAIALGYAKEALRDACVVFGAETPEQVTENADIWMKDVPRGLCARIRDTFKGIGEDIINPVKWAS